MSAPLNSEIGYQADRREVPGEGVVIDWRPVHAPSAGELTWDIAYHVVRGRCFTLRRVRDRATLRIWESQLWRIFDGVEALRGQCPGWEFAGDEMIARALAAVGHQLFESWDAGNPYELERTR